MFMAHVREFVLVPLHVITILPWPLRIGPFSICFVWDTSFFPVKSRCPGSHKPTVSLKRGRLINQESTSLLLDIIFWRINDMFWTLVDMFSPKSTEISRGLPATGPAVARMCSIPSWPMLKANWRHCSWWCSFRCMDHQPTTPPRFNKAFFKRKPMVLWGGGVR